MDGWVGGWLGGWLYEHENITNSATNSVEVGAGAELGKTKIFFFFQANKV